MGEPEYIHIAAKMLELDPHDFRQIHPAIAQKLDQVNQYCRKADGRLVSRLVSHQVIGNIIMQHIANG